MSDFKTYAKNCRRVIPEGLVLLEQDGALPLTEGESIALFGRGQFEYVKSGTGNQSRAGAGPVILFALKAVKKNLIAS